MKVLTFTSYKEHCELYTIIHGLIAVRGCQIGLARNRHNIRYSHDNRDAL